MLKRLLGLGILITLALYSWDQRREIAQPDGPIAVLERIKIYQSGRYYFWQAPRLPIPGREISRYSANMHMIPSSNEIARALKRVRRGQVIQLSGHLVKIEAPDGWQWRSSLSRMDTGNGSCEIIYVKAFRIRDT